LAVCHRLIPQIPKSIVAVAESGISTVDEVILLARGGADAILVGEALVKGGDPTETVQEWTYAGTQERNTDGVR